MAGARFAPAPFGLACAAALLAGVLCLQWAPRLPPWPLAALAAALGVLAWWRGGRWRWAGALLAGLAWASLHGSAALSLRLPQALSGSEVRVEGQVLGLPVADDDAVRFDFRVDRVHGGLAWPLAGRRLRVGWYATPGDTTPLPAVAPGSRWQFEVSLRPPRGVLNPGGHDAERRALEQRLSATAVVREAANARRLAAGRGLDALRGRLSERIADAVPGPGARFVRALALGDTRHLDDHDWQVLRATGLTHLIAISGFHVGLVAGLGVLLARAAHALRPGLGLRVPRPQSTAAAALVLAFAYTALAGFALPTVRTLLMIAAVLLARLGRRPQSGGQSLAFALVAVLVVDPLSVLSPGFWLSFLGVAWLLWCLPSAPGQGLLRPFLQAQGVAVLGLLPLTVWFFGQASLPGPLANLVGIPVISLGVVPLSLAGLGLDPLWPAAGAASWQAAAWTMDRLWMGLAQVASWPAATLWLPEPTALTLGLALAGAFWLLLPRGVPGKALAALLLVPLLWPALERPPPGEAELVLVDVGQGLSVLVLTERHAVLYDTGPAGPRGPDLGEAAVLPLLRARGVRHLDRVLVSHGDNDHAGGLASILDAVPAGGVLAPDGWRGPGMRPCREGGEWSLDGVRFRLLHPPRHLPYLGNDSSCVLRIETADGTVALLPGDIGRHVEARLQALHPEAIRSDLLVVPHHGSDSSSSLDFLAATRPRLALLAVGEGNRFGLPKPRVLDRYDRYGVALLDSAGSGAIRIALGPGGPRVIERFRQDRPRYWRDAGPGRTGYAIGSPRPDR